MGEKGLSKDALRAISRIHAYALQQNGFEISGDGKTAFNPTTGQNVTQDLNTGTWTDNKTGEPVM